MLYTSGTTANPKGAIHRHGAIVAQGELMAERMRFAEGDVFWTPLPFFHVGGIATLAGTIAGGVPSVQQGFFEPGEALDLLERERCTVAFPAFETIWLAVLNHPRFAEADLTALRLVINVGVRTTLESMQARVPHAPQVSCTGSTETCAFACIGEPDDPLETRLTTSGRPLRSVEVRTVDPETGADRGPGVVGELLFRGPTLFVRYHDDPESTALAIDDDGWFHTGDLGTLDAEGRVSFVGRLKDMLKVGGENVAAADVESYLLTHPAAEIVQVVGVPDARYIEVPAAFVQLRQGATATEAGARGLLPRADRDVQGPALRPLRRRMADVGHEDPEVPPPRAARRRAGVRGDHRGAADRIRAMTETVAALLDRAVDVPGRRGRDAR